MPQLIGEYIRQLRRQHGLTQTELGAERFSKSYVSAVERDKIVPTPQALVFFAEQLGQHDEYFEKLRDSQQFITVSERLSLDYDDNHQSFPEEVLSLLDNLLINMELPRPPLLQIPPLSPEVIATLPGDKQARYFFLRGLIAQEKGELNLALHSLEHALTFASAKYQIAILDELGNNYYLEQNYHAALGYHKRALSMLQADKENNEAAILHVKLEVHCGDDRRLLGSYNEARIHYERARSYLSTAHDLKTAGQVYLGLGYCTYACAYQHSDTMQHAAGRIKLEEVEREFQQAVTFLLQSRTLYQVSGDRMGESHARLLQAMTLLDLSTYTRRTAREGTNNITFSSAICTSLLDEAEEQCRQILMGWQEVFSDMRTPPVKLEIVLYTALSYLIRIRTQRASLAYLGDYIDTATRERSLAGHLYQKVLGSLREHTFPWTLIGSISRLDSQNKDIVYQPQALPHLPALHVQTESAARSVLSQAEVYFAAGEFAEELGSSATKTDFIYNCYRQADQCFHAALRITGQETLNKERDPSYLARSYQRYINILEERVKYAPEVAEETLPTLINIMKEGLSIAAIR